MNWIKFEVTTPQKREILVMSRAMKLPRPHVVGLVLHFWAWADAETVDGMLHKLTQEDVDAVVDHEGFAAALIAAGWLLDDGDGLLIPNWGRHNGKNAKKRAMTARRQEAYRARQADS